MRLRLACPRALTLAAAASLRRPSRAACCDSSRSRRFRFSSRAAIFSSRALQPNAFLCQGQRGSGPSEHITIAEPSKSIDRLRSPDSRYLSSQNTQSACRFAIPRCDDDCFGLLLRQLRLLLGRIVLGEGGAPAAALGSAALHLVEEGRGGCVLRGGWRTRMSGQYHV